MVNAEQLYQKLKNIHVGNPVCQFTRENCQLLLPTIERIENLKQEKNAIILAHNYVAPQIFYSVADYTGDSYGLSKNAKRGEKNGILKPQISGEPPPPCDGSNASLRRRWHRHLRGKFQSSASDCRPHSSRRFGHIIVSPSEHFAGGRTDARLGVYHER